MSMTVLNIIVLGVDMRYSVMQRALYDYESHFRYPACRFIDLENYSKTTSAKTTLFLVIVSAEIFGRHGMAHHAFLSQPLPNSPY